MEKENFLTQAWFDPKLFYPKNCVNFNKRDISTKQCKMLLTTSISNTRLPHIYKGKNYVISLACSSFESKSKNLPNKSHKYYPKKRKIAT